MQDAYVFRTLAGHEAHIYKTIDSTNACLARLALSGAAHGLVIVADEQTEGRGRMGRKWVSMPGAGAWFSLLVRPEDGGAGGALTPSFPGARIDAARAAELVFVCALGMARAVRALSRCDAKIKWPNDLVAGGRKLAGMMCQMQAKEGALDWAVLGIGVNLTDAALSDALAQATSIARESGDSVPRDALIAQFLKNFDALYAIYCAHGLAPILEEIAPLSVTLGARVRVCEPNSEDTLFEGTATRFLPDGALLVRTDGGEEQTVRAGDVRVRGAHGYA